jgi:hypothetical protein
LRYPALQNRRQPFAVYLYYKFKDIFGKQKTILCGNRFGEAGAFKIPLF